MRFNQFFDLMNEFADVDSENFNDAEVEIKEDIDVGGYCISYKLDPTKYYEEEYISTIDDLLESYSISNYKVEENYLLFSIK